MREKQWRSKHHAKSLRKDLTTAEELLWYDLRKQLLGGHKFRRQHPVGDYIADFACIKAKTIIEVDGATHDTKQERDYDDKRTQYLESQGWNVIRVSNEDIYKHREDTLNHIYLHLPPPSARAGTSPVNGERERKKD